MARNYAEQLVDTLEKQCVERIYGLVGDSLNPIVEGNTNLYSATNCNDRSVLFIAL